MNIPTKQLEIFFKRRNELIKELSIRKIDKLSFLEKNYELIQNLNMKPLLNISSLEEGMYNYQYYNILAKFFKQKSILYSNNKKKQKKYNENLMKSNNYYAEKDKYLLKMIDFLDEKTTESYFIDMNSKRLNNSLFEIVVKDVDFAIFHSMNIEILQKLKEKNTEIFVIFRFIFVLYWMDLSTLIPDIFPHQVAVGTVSLFQSLIAGLLGTSVFVILVLVYSHLKKRNPYNRFVQGVDLIVE